MNVWDSRVRWQVRSLWNTCSLTSVWKTQQVSHPILRDVAFCNRAVRKTCYIYSACFISLLFFLMQLSILSTFVILYTQHYILNIFLLLFKIRMALQSRQIWDMYFQYVLCEEDCVRFWKMYGERDLLKIECVPLDFLIYGMFFFHNVSCLKLWILPLPAHTNPLAKDDGCHWESSSHHLRFFIHKIVQSSPLLFS